MNKIIEKDVAAISQRLPSLRKVQGSTWLISGGAGFLGGYFLDLLAFCNRTLFTQPCRVICVDTFFSGWERVEHLKEEENFSFIASDISQPLDVGEVDYVVHAASIASPTFYRRYPLKTIEANVLGLWNLLELAQQRDVQGFLYFSSSEIYGNPPPKQIPTAEDYNGNVSCTGPRACYDESKRLGETLVVNYHGQYGLPVVSVRPFNIYGPGLRLEDRRVLPDFFHDALFNQKISIYSDGSPTRSFCYVEDAIVGFMAALLSSNHGEAFNIGNDEREISMKELALVVAELVGGVEVEFHVSEDGDYLIDNPQRRCPDLSKARRLLNYQARIGLEEGLTRALAWYKDAYPLGR